MAEVADEGEGRFAVGEGELMDERPGFGDGIERGGGGEEGFEFFEWGESAFGGSGNFWCC